MTLIFFFKRDDHCVYKSKFVEKLWSLGFVSVEDVTYQSARYCAKYLQKLNSFPSDVLKPFTFMSLKPGIGLGAFSNKSFETDKIYFNGKTYGIPRYFRRKLPHIDNFSDMRKLRGKLLSSTLELRRAKAKSKFFIIKS